MKLMMVLTFGSTKYAQFFTPRTLAKNNKNYELMQKLNASYLSKYSINQ